MEGHGLRADQIGIHLHFDGLRPEGPQRRTMHKKNVMPVQDCAEP